MNSTEIRNKIIQHVEFFDEDQLEAFYDILLNFIESRSEITNDTNLAKEEINGNFNSNNQEEIKNKEEHERVIRELRARYKKY